MKDPIKQEAADAINEVRSQLNIKMVSGDCLNTAKYVAI